MATDTIEIKWNNLQVALLNSLALVTAVRIHEWLATGKTVNHDILRAVGEGGGVPVSSTALAKACGYKSLTGYHNKLLDELVEGGYITTEYAKGEKVIQRWFSITPKGYEMTIERIKKLK